MRPLLSPTRYTLFYFLFLAFLFAIDGTQSYSILKSQSISSQDPSLARTLKVSHNLACHIYAMILARPSHLIGLYEFDTNFK